jgi:hypothetical protein
MGLVKQLNQQQSQVIKKPKYIIGKDKDDSDKHKINQTQNQAALRKNIITTSQVNIHSQ